MCGDDRVGGHGMNTTLWIRTQGGARLLKFLGVSHLSSCSHSAGPAAFRPGLHVAPAAAGGRYDRRVCFKINDWMESLYDGRASGQDLCRPAIPPPSLKGRLQWIYRGLHSFDFMATTCVTCVCIVSLSRESSSDRKRRDSSHRSGIPPVPARRPLGFCLQLISRCGRSCFMATA